MSTPGFALERTRLAWRRTALGLAAGSVAAGRLLQDVVGPDSWLVALAGLAAAGIVVRLAWRRHTTEAPEGGRGGRLVASMALGTTVIGVAAFVVLVTGHGRLV